MFTAIIKYQALGFDKAQAEPEGSNEHRSPAAPRQLTSLNVEHTCAHLTKPRNGTFKVKLRTKCISEAMVEVLESLVQT